MLCGFVHKLCAWKLKACCKFCEKAIAGFDNVVQLKLVLNRKTTYDQCCDMIWARYDLVTLWIRIWDMTFGTGDSLIWIWVWLSKTQSQSRYVLTERLNLWSWLSVCFWSRNLKTSKTCDHCQSELHSVFLEGIIDLWSVTTVVRSIINRNSSTLVTRIGPWITSTHNPTDNPPSDRFPEISGGLFVAFLDFLNS